MAIPTSRTKQKAQIRIDAEKCTGCGLCVSVCKDFGFILEDGKAKLSSSPMFGCVACGHCMAICPEGAISISGRTLSPGDLYDLPAGSEAADYKRVLALFQRRRSIREFVSREVETEIIEKIIEAAKNAPMGIPPSDVNVLVFNGRTANLKFAEDFCDFLQGIKWMFSKWAVTLMKPFLSKADYEMFRDFLKPVIEVFTGEMKKGINLVNYDAPLSMYFYGSPYTDPADPIVAASYAMIAGESLGLGTCMIGAVHPFIQYGKKARKFRELHGIKFASREGVIVLFGYPAVKYNKGIRRTFASVTGIYPGVN